MQICKLYIYSIINKTNKISYSRTVAVTVNTLKRYKEIVINTTSDLEERLQKINNKF
jgi:hypothetical protein